VLSRRLQRYVIVSLVAAMVAMRFFFIRRPLMFDIGKD
jgi:hypothetical protein